MITDKIYSKYVDIRKNTISLKKSINWKVDKPHIWLILGQPHLVVFEQGISELLMSGGILSETR